jgi:hypothetical protein
VRSRLNTILLLCGHICACDLRLLLQHWRMLTACLFTLAVKLEPTIVYTLSKKEADDIGASLKVHMCCAP